MPRSKDKKTKAKDVEQEEEEESNEEEEYEVEEILKRRIREGGIVEYKLKWKGWPVTDATWQVLGPDDCPELRKAFDAKMDAERAEKAKSSTNKKSKSNGRSSVDRHSRENSTTKATSDKQTKRARQKSATPMQNANESSTPSKKPRRVVIEDDDIEPRPSAPEPHNQRPFASKIGTTQKKSPARAPPQRQKRKQNNDKSKDAVSKRKPHEGEQVFPFDISSDDDTTIEIVPPSASNKEAKQPAEKSNKQNVPAPENGEAIISSTSGVDHSLLVDSIFARNYAPPSPSGSVTSQRLYIDESSQPTPQPNEENLAEEVRVDSPPSVHNQSSDDGSVICIDEVELPQRSFFPVKERNSPTTSAVQTTHEPPIAQHEENTTQIDLTKKASISDAHATLPQSATETANLCLAQARLDSDLVREPSNASTQMTVAKSSNETAALNLSLSTPSARDPPNGVAAQATAPTERANEKVIEQQHNDENINDQNVPFSREQQEVQNDAVAVEPGVDLSPNYQESVGSHSSTDGTSSAPKASNTGAALPVLADAASNFALEAIREYTKRRELEATIQALCENPKAYQNPFATRRNARVEHFGNTFKIQDECFVTCQFEGEPRKHPARIEDVRQSDAENFKKLVAYLHAQSKKGYRIIY